MWPKRDGFAIDVHLGNSHKGSRATITTVQHLYDGRIERAYAKLEVDYSRVVILRAGDCASIVRVQRTGDGFSLVGQVVCEGRTCCTV